MKTCDKKIIEQSNTITEIKTKLCQDQSVNGAIDQYITKKNEFLDKRKEFNVVENQYEDEERKFKK